MSDILDSLEIIRENLEADQKRIIRLQGKLDAKLEHLATKGMNGAAEAMERVKKLSLLSKKVNKKLNTLVEVFKKDYPELIGEQHGKRG